MRQIIKRIIPNSIIMGYRSYKKEKELRKFEGNNVECVVCGSTFNVFAPYGVTKRDNALCPNCGSLERHRLLWKYLHDKTTLFTGARRLKLLHVAPEKAYYDVFCEANHIEYYPCDLFPEMFNYKGSVKVQKVDITRIPFEENYFDVIICNHVLELIPDDKLAMQELFRVMKTPSWGIFQVPVDFSREETYEDFTITTREEREKVFGWPDHVRWYGRDYKARLNNVGFEVLENAYASKFSKEELFRYGLMGSELIFFCTK